MRESFFDYDNGEFLYSMSKDILMSSGGHLMSRMSYNSAIDLTTGELHSISFFDLDDDEEE